MAGYFPDRPYMHPVLVATYAFLNFADSSQQSLATLPLVSVLCRLDCSLWN